MPRVIDNLDPCSGRPRSHQVSRDSELRRQMPFQVLESCGPLCLVANLRASFTNPGFFRATGVCLCVLAVRGGHTRCELNSMAHRPAVKHLSDLRVRVVD